MTFYNVVSAVIFLGAFRELLTALQSSNSAAIARSSVLALLVFNDAIYTSWTIETRQKRYGPNLMLIDLINFLIFAAALISLNSTQNNIFQLDLTGFASWLNESRFWLLLAVYWGLIMWWTYRAGVYSEPKYPKWLVKWAALTGILFLIQSLLVAVFGGVVAYTGTLIATIYPFAYILGIRNYVLRSGID